MDLKEEMLKLEDDFALQREDLISAVVSLGEGEAQSIELPHLQIEFSEPKPKKEPVHTIIENVELTRRGTTAGLF